jgi:hypothetical protein
MDDNEQTYNTNAAGRRLPSTAWKKGGPSPNPKGRGHVPSRFSKKLVEDFAAHWRKHGETAIQKVYAENPGLYLKIAVSLVPRELLIAVSKDPNQMTDFELQQAAEEERLQQLKVIEHIKEKVGKQIIEEATREVMGDDDADTDDAA